MLRTLDAIHLAAALDLGDDLRAIVTYDARLAMAAAWNGRMSMIWMAQGSRPPEGAGL